MGDNLLKKEFKEKFIPQISKDPTQTFMLSEKYWDEDIKQAGKQVWIQKILINPSAYENCPQQFKNLPEFKEAQKQGWIEAVRKNPVNLYHKWPIDSYATCPQELKDLPEIKEAYKQGWMQVVQETFYVADKILVYSKCPQEFKHWPEIQELGKKAWMQTIQHDPRTFATCPQELKDLPEIKEAGKIGRAHV